MTFARRFSSNRVRPNVGKVHIAARFAACAGIACLAGCAMQVAPATQTAGVALTGKMIGGQQPVNGATISLYAAGSTGNGTGAVSLLRTPVLTSAQGSFSISGDFTCPTSATQVYLVGTGGNPGLPGRVTNPALAMMTALGDCGSLSASTFIYVNEVTTAAAAWGLAQFLGPAANIGSSATNANGLRNAFLVAGNLADTATGLPSGPSLPAGASLEVAKLNTLANVIANCVNSDGGTGCAPLFLAATSGTSALTNTIDAARNIVRHPAANVEAIFNASPSQGPFQPVLSQAPNDWGMTLTYTGGGLKAPTALAVDSTGNVWVANYYGGVATKLSPTGAPVAANGFADAGLNESYGLTVDIHDNAWITNQETSYQVNSGGGSLSKFSSNGQVLSGAGIGGGGIFYPYATAADSNGNIWVADYGHSGATILANDGTSLAGATGYQSSKLPLPVGVALDGVHNAWFAAEGSAVRVTPAGVVSQFSCCRVPSAVAVDANSNVWVADYSASALIQISSSGLQLQSLNAGGVYFPEGLAIDGAGAVWSTNYRGNTVSAFGGATGGAASAILSPAKGFGYDSSLGQPFGIALDASGNVWVTNFGMSTVTQLVGLATPIRTPLVGPPAQP